MVARLKSTSSSVVTQDETLMRIAVWPCQTVEPHQQVPSACRRATVRRVFSGVPNDTSTWLITTSFRISIAGGAQARGESAGVARGALDNLRHA